MLTVFDLASLQYDACEGEHYYEKEESIKY